MSVVANLPQGSFSVALLKEILLNNNQPGDVTACWQPLLLETFVLNTPIAGSIKIIVNAKPDKTVNFHSRPVFILIELRPA